MIIKYVLFFIIPSKIFLCMYMSEVSLKRFYPICSIWWWTYFKTSKIGVYQFLKFKFFIYFSKVHSVLCAVFLLSLTLCSAIVRLLAHPSTRQIQLLAHTQMHCTLSLIFLYYTYWYIGIGWSFKQNPHCELHRCTSCPFIVINFSIEDIYNAAVITN